MYLTSRMFWRSEEFEADLVMVIATAPAILHHQFSDYNNWAENP